MWDWIRGGSIALAGLLVGLAAGYCLWAERPGGGFELRYEEGERVLVKSVIDGDTVRLADGMHVRYRGCDTPEIFRFIRDPGPGADEASARNRELVEGAWVRLRFPPSGRPAIDAHGRLLADVYLDTGEPSSETAARGTGAEALVREGLAKVNAYEMEGAPLERLRAAEAEAREAKRGIWSESASEVIDAPFVASRHGKYVHRTDCEYAKKISRRNLMKFHTLKAGLSTKRGRCPGCLGRKGNTRKREKATGGARP